MRKSIFLILAVLLVPAMSQALTLEFAFLIDQTTDIPVGGESIAVGIDPVDSELGIFVGDSEGTGDILVYKQTSPGVWSNAVIDGGRRFTPAIGPFGLDFLPNGNLLVMGGGSGLVREVDAGTGALVAMGISFTFGGFDDLEAGVWADNALYLSGEPVSGASLVHRLTLAGAAENLPGLGTNTFVYGDLDAFNDAGASAYDAINQRIYVGDDSSGSSGGFGIAPSKIQVFDLSGNLIDESGLMRDVTAGVNPTLDALCGAHSRGQCDDLEGLEFFTFNGEDHLLMVFEDQRVVVAMKIIPEPTTLALLVLAGAGVCLRRRTRQSA